MKKIFSTLAFTILITGVGLSQYTWQLKLSGGGRGNPITVSSVDNNVIYYGSSDAILKSTDRGETFVQLGNVIPVCSAVKCLHIHPQKPNEIVVAVYKGTNYKMVKTTDNGTTWITTADNLTFSYYGVPSTQDPTHPDTLYLMNGINFDRSTDFGSTWSTLTSSVGANSAPCDIEVFPDTSIILVGDNGTGVFKSTNYGLTWSQTYNTTGEIPTIAVDFNQHGTAWATKYAGGGGIIRSTDYGQTWTTVAYSGVSTWGVHINPNNSNYVAVGTWSGSNVYITRDWGTSWQTTTLTPNNYSVAIIDSMNVFAGQSGGIYKLSSPYFVPYDLTSFSALIEGLYDGSTLVSDTVTVELHNAASPYSLIDKTKIFLNSSGNGSGKFYNISNATPYYLVVKHRSGLETWSNQPQSFSTNQLSYDFTSAQNKAYGNNLKLIGSKWCIYNGDVNQDGFINSQDLNMIFYDNVSGTTGYKTTDLNGDMFTEVGDLNIVFINNVLKIEKKSP